MHSTDKAIVAVAEVAQRNRARLALGAAAVVTAGAIAGSASSLYEIAVAARLALPLALPVALDLLALTAAAAVRHRRRDWLAWLILAGSTAVSTALQVSAAGPVLRDQVVHGAVPVAALLAFEMAMRASDPAGQPADMAIEVDKVQVSEPLSAPDWRTEALARQAETDRRLGRPNAGWAPPPPEVSAPEPVRPAKQPAPEAGDPVLSTVRAMVLAGEEVTAKALAERLGKTDRTARRHLSRSDVRAILDESSHHALDSSGMLARTGACEDRSEQSPPLSASDPSGLAPSADVAEVLS
jgi:DNA-binding transcriptional ArsR family regulator